MLSCLKGLTISFNIKTVQENLQLFSLSNYKVEQVPAAKALFKCKRKASCFTYWKQSRRSYSLTNIREKYKKTRTCIVYMRASEKHFGIQNYCLFLEIDSYLAMHQSTMIFHIVGISIVLFLFPFQQ